MKNTLSSTRPMFSISVVADTLQVHQRTLRIYDALNLLSPDRTPKNRRLYSVEDIEKGQLIQYMTKELGINLQGVKMLLALEKMCKDRSRNIFKDLEIDHIVKLCAETAEITPEMQEINKTRLSKRGRKKIVKIV